MAKSLYFIAIEIPSPLKEEIISLKTNFIKKYGARHALNSPPHITLKMPMRIENEKEVLLVRSLADACLKINRNSYKLKGISSFPPRTVFIDVESSDWLKRTREIIQDAMEKGEFSKQDGPFHPHVTLMTRDLKKTAYKQAMNDLKNVRFDRDLRADVITLFKHDGKQWNSLSPILLT